MHGTIRWNLLRQRWPVARMIEYRPSPWTSFEGGGHARVSMLQRTRREVANYRDLSEKAVTMAIGPLFSRLFDGDQRRAQPRETENGPGFCLKRVN